MADNQAEADQTDETPVADPLDAANHSQNGTTDLSAYEDEIEAMKQGGEIQLGDDDELEQSADDETETLGDPDDLADDTAEEEEEEAEEEEASARSQERFRFKSDDDKAVAAIAKAKGVSLVEAARIYSGEPAKAAESTQEQQQSAQSENLASVEAEIDELYEQKDAAIRAIDVDAQAELEKQIRQLEKKARQLAVTEAENAARNQQTQLERDTQVFDAAWDKSRKHYPALSDPNSAMYKEVQRLEAEAIEMGDPLAGDPARLWDFAKKAGLNTRTPMTKPSSAPTKGKTGSPIKPAAGNRGTTSADANQGFVQKVEGLQSLDAYEDEIRRMKGELV